MSLPKHLLQSFEEIKRCPLIAGVFTKESVQQFVNILNRSIPADFYSVAASGSRTFESNSHTIYRHHRSLYIANPERYLKFIKDFPPYDALILWTNYDHILDHFNLTNKIFLGWSKVNNQYRAFIHDQTPEPEQIKILRRGEKLSSFKKEKKSNPFEELDIEDALFDKEMDRIYSYMNERMKMVANSRAVPQVLETISIQTSL